ncbi:rod shape-determining protein MreC [Ferrimonas lipolytica]|uniref:Cell shape-determining protein MreC n=1 Tax=Ferrimonas lipolytica TaxID=2724191 RepID=A0A6H1UH28_9GAMM|nr:rod shape-determining protein MreC [Ferrimonas lipolytica]QIZ77910.1 rod shape-determining protein MreC [Ferrimonas lipolytica]
MKPFFLRGIALEYRLAMAVLFCLGLIFFNQQLAPVRSTLATLVSPIQYLAAMPSNFFDGLSDNFATRANLLDDNKRLQQQQLLNSERLLRLRHLEQENQRLRALLDSPTQVDSRRVVAEVIEVDQDPFKHQVMINKGSSDRVYLGQPVLDSNGVVGQVIEVGQTASRVLLISDLTHAIPVRNSRNDVRAIAHGGGQTDILELPNVAMNTDLQEGDVLMTSGLGGRFPEGYPVAQITSVVRAEGQTFAEITAAPEAKLARIRYLLLLWHNEEAANDR